MEERNELNHFTFSGRKVPEPGHFGYIDKIIGSPGHSRMFPTYIESVVLDPTTGNVNLTIHISIMGPAARLNEHRVVLPISDEVIINNLPDLLAGKLSCMEFANRVVNREGHDVQQFITAQITRPILEIRQELEGLARIDPNIAARIEGYNARFNLERRLEYLLALFPRNFDNRYQIIVPERMRVISGNVEQALRAFILQRQAAADAPVAGGNEDVNPLRATPAPHPAPAAPPPGAPRPPAAAAPAPAAAAPRPPAAAAPAADAPLPPAAAPPIAAADAAPRPPPATPEAGGNSPPRGENNTLPDPNEPVRAAGVGARARAEMAAGRRAGAPAEEQPQDPNEVGGNEPPRITQV